MQMLLTMYMDQMHMLCAVPQLAAGHVWVLLPCTVQLAAPFTNNVLPRDSNHS